MSGVGCIEHLNNSEKNGLIWGRSRDLVDYKKNPKKLNMAKMDTGSFASQYITLSRATGSVCDTLGNRVELKNIPKLLHKFSRGQFKLVWSESFCALHFLERNQIAEG